jgi:membrane-associated phospholipid phosphatase
MEHTRPASTEPSNKQAPTRWARWLVRARRLKPLLWLVFLSVSLVLFWAFLPHSVRLSLGLSLQTQAPLALMIVSFLLLTLSLLWSAGQRLDDWGFTYLNMRGGRPRWLDVLMVIFTQIGNGLTAILLALFYYFDGPRRLAYELLLGLISLWLVVELIKALVQRPRPFFKVDSARLVGYRDRGRSFPSGHTSQAFFLATLLAQRFTPEPWVVIGLYFVALLVGLTRMYVGAHYPRDVLAGAILGSAWGLMIGVI